VEGKMSGQSDWLVISERELRTKRGAKKGMEF
jgi:hypothetical protein